MTSLAYIALWIFVFTVPWENVIVITGVGAISRLMGMLALGLALLAAVISGRVRRWHAFHFAALAFLVWVSFGLLFVPSGPHLPRTYWTYVQLFLVLWMIWELSPTIKRQLGLLMAYVYGAYVAALSTILVFRSEGAAARRFAAEGFDPNDLAMTLALALPMAWYLGMNYRHPFLRWSARLYLPVGLVALGLTGSRGGMLAGMIGLLIVPLTMVKLSPARLATAILLLGISGSVAMSYIPEQSMTRLASTRAEVEGGSLGGRVHVWRAGFRAFLQRPITGYSVGSFEGVVLPILGEARSSHNSYLTVLVEEGIVGFLLYATMFCAVFLAVLRLPKLERRFALVLLATLAIAMLPLAWEDHKAVWFIMAALLGLSQAQGAWTTSAEPKPAPPLAGTRAPMASRPRPLTAPVRSAGRDGTA